MTERKTFKRRVRERMSKTGESYTAARRQVAEKRERNASARARLAAADERMPDESVQRATGRTWDEWFSVLDESGATSKPHREIARFLMEEHGVGGWWAQSVTVWYERARGMRVKHQQADGFSISASKTLAVPLEVLYEAFVNDGRRAEWLTDGTMSLRTAQPNRSARFDWDDGSTRVNVSFIEKGPSKATVAVAHERLPDADDAETAKSAWKQRLASLKSFLEN